jgi:hypothetical protein
MQWLGHRRIKKPSINLAVTVYLEISKAYQVGGMTDTICNSCMDKNEFLNSTEPAARMGTKNKFSPPPVAVERPNYEVMLKICPSTRNAAENSEIGRP